MPSVESIWNSAQMLDTSHGNAAIPSYPQRIATALTPQPTASSRSAASSILFVDTQVDDYQSLVAGVKADTEVYLLNSAEEAIAQITQALTGRSGISSLQILSHGAAGSLQLGADWVGVNHLDRNAAQLQSWSSAFNDQADILLYGCNVAEGAEGQAFVQRLAQLTGADVAASTDLTGSAALGGNWNLEVATGEIEATISSSYPQGVAISANESESYSSILGVDSKVNLFTRNARTGAVQLLKADTLEFNGMVNLPTVSDLNWRIETTGDFDCDGDNDLLWRNLQSKELAFWEMDGENFSKPVYLPSVEDLNWKIEGLGDFDQDANLDFLWRNYSTGEVAFWKMNKMSFEAAVFLPTVKDANWQVEDIGDFDRDGNLDLLWRHHSIGEISIWKMNKMSYETSVSVFTLKDFNWQIKEVGDFDNDGDLDLLWHHDRTGEVALWKMDQMSFETAVSMNPVNLDWRIEATRDLDSDGALDLVWKNYHTQEVALWKMNQTSSVEPASLYQFAESDWSIARLIAPLNDQIMPK